MKKEEPASAKADAGTVNGKGVIIMYKTVLKKHWNSLVNDFEKTCRAMDIANVPVSELQKWYNVRSHRFKSAFTEEGKALQGLEQEELVFALTEKIDAFVFCKAEGAETVSLKNRLILLGVSMVVLFFLFPMVGLESLLIRFLLVVVGFIVGFLWQLHQVNTEAADRRDRITEAYRNQLEAHLQKLLNLYDRFEL